MTTLDLKLSGAGGDSKGSFKKVFFFSLKTRRWSTKNVIILSTSAALGFLCSHQTHRNFFLCFHSILKQYKFKTKKICKKNWRKNQVVAHVPLWFSYVFSLSFCLF